MQLPKALYELEFNHGSIYGPEEQQALAEVLASSAPSCGPKVKQFEEAFAAHCKTAHALAVSSATAGLELAMIACEVGPGDEVITTPLSWISTANAIAARGGFPTRYPHWRFGMEYEQLSKGYHYGLQKIYEMVINNDPCYAYLLSPNGLVDQKLVMAHVYGHCDFFKNNQWFSHTSRKMMDEMANHGNRIRRYIDRFGIEAVEEFIDSCLCLEDLIDIHSVHIKRRDETSRYNFHEDEHEEDPNSGGRFQAKGYMDSFINPREILAEQSARRQEERRKKDEHFPAHPEQDVMLFLLEHAPLKPWQLDVLSIIRDEAYYFAPQGQTKIMNEGWASYWHSTIMTHNTLDPNEVVCYCDHHSGTLAGSANRLNPYKLGIELFRDIEDRWNKGRFGKDYDDCDDMVAKREWDTQAGLGREKIFEVRRIYNDLTFIDTFLTLDFCREHKLFKFGYNPDSEYYEIESRA
ncbi:MAG: SpoVR family protein, partial [Pirellulales bacterium]